MPHSTASFRHLAQWYATEFHSEMRKKLSRDDPRTLSQFESLIAMLFQRAIPNHIATERINACLSQYPEFCDRIIGFYPDGTIQLKETIPMRMRIPDTPPAHFTQDIMQSIVPLLPFPTLGRLAKTCKWMNAHISQWQVDRALQRCRELFDTVTILTEPSSGRRMIRMYTRDEEVIEAGFMHQNRQIAILRLKNRTYLGVPTASNMHYRGFVDLYDHATNLIVEKRLQEVREELMGAEHQKQPQQHQKPIIIWAKYRLSHGTQPGAASGDVLFVQFFANFNTPLVSNEVSMQFTEFVP